MRLAAVFLVLAGLARVCCAATYHVAPGGDDSADGLARTAERPGRGPFASFAPFAGISLAPGDRILLACGGRYSGRLDLHLAIASDLPVEVASEGACDRARQPVIDGRESLVAATGLQTFPGRPLVTQVWLGDELLPAARVPASGYQIFEPTTVAEKDQLPSRPPWADKDLRGAHVLARTQEYFIEERDIENSRGKFDEPLRWELRPKVGLYLTGKLWMIGTTDAWAYDRAERTLYVRNARQRPLRVAYAGSLVSVEGKGSVTIRGLRLESAGTDGLDLHVSGNVIVDDVTILRSSHDSIAISGARTAAVTHSLLEDSGRDGIFFAEVGRATVRDNTVRRAGMFQGPQESLAGIDAHRTSAAVIERNHVVDTAYIGIRFSGDARVRRNLIERSCLRLSDCAAVYTWRQNVGHVLPPVEVSGNVILGVAGDTTVRTGDIDFFAGIYLDEFTRYATLKNNVIVGTSQGVYIHNSILNSARNNMIIDSKEMNIRVGVDKNLFPPGSDLTNVVQANVITDKQSAWNVSRSGSPGDVRGFKEKISIRVQAASAAGATGDSARQSESTCVSPGFAEARPSAGDEPSATVTVCKP